MSINASNFVIAPKPDAPEMETLGGITAGKIVVVGKPEVKTVGNITAGSIVVVNKPKPSYATLWDPRVLQKKTDKKTNRVSDFMYDMTTVHKL